jgi:hypothetical protein
MSMSWTNLIYYTYRPPKTTSSFSSPEQTTFQPTSHSTSNDTPSPSPTDTANASSHPSLTSRSISSTLIKLTTIHHDTSSALNPVSSSTPNTTNQSQTSTDSSSYYDDGIVSSTSTSKNPTKTIPVTSAGIKVTSSVFPTSSASNTRSIDGKRSSNIGVIVGGVLGGLALITIAGICVCVFRRRHKRLSNTWLRTASLPSSPHYSIDSGALTNNSSHLSFIYIAYSGMARSTR